MAALNNGPAADASQADQVRPNLPKTACEASKALFELMPFQKRHVEEKSASLGLTAPLCGLLWRLEQNSPCSMGHIADFMHCDASNVTSMVDKLESRGLVHRQPSPEDRRVKLIVLTPAGIEFREELFARVSEPTEWILALDEQDQAELARILRKAKQLIGEPART